jgi:hypothetical protein
MAYKKPANKWNDLTEVKIIPRNENSQLRISAVQKEGSEDVFISFREFSRYLTKDERAEGKKLEDMILRPTSNGCTIPFEELGDLIDSLSEVRDDLEADGFVIEEE